MSIGSRQAVYQGKRHVLEIDTSSSRTWNVQDPAPGRVLITKLFRINTEYLRNL